MSVGTTGHTMGYNVKQRCFNVVQPCCVCRSVSNQTGSSFINLFRIMHHPRMYQHIHKIHHEFTASISVSSLYSHPFEHVASNILSVFLGPFIMGSHVASLLLWSCIAVSATQISHSGYHLPFLPSPEAHDYHHLK